MSPSWIVPEAVPRHGPVIAGACSQFRSRINGRLRAVKDLFLLDPAVVYLNHGSFGACPRPVFEAYQGLQRELERQPVEFLALERRFPARLDAARLELAAYVGAPPDELVFATNASSALNSVIRSLPLGTRRRGPARGRRVRRARTSSGATSPRRPARRWETVRGARAWPANARPLLLAHRVERPGASTISAGLVGRACRRGSLDRRRCARARPDRARARSARGRRLRRELPQVAVRAEGLGVSLRASRRRRTGSSRSSSRGTGSTARRSTTATAGRAPATRLRSSQYRRRSHSRPSTTGLGRECAAARC